MAPPVDCLVVTLNFFFCFQLLILFAVYLKPLSVRRAWEETQSMGDEEEQIQSQNKYNQKQKRNEEGNHDGDNDEDASASIISPTSVRDTPTLACSISSSHRDPVAVSTQRPVTPHKVDDDNGCESGDDDDDDADDDNNNTNNQNNDNNSDCNNDDGDKACDELIAAPSPVMVFETRRPETATSPCYYHSDFDFNPADPRPCFHCIDMCGAFFENLYAAQTLPFSTPQWVVNHPNFESVIRTVQSRAFPTGKFFLFFCCINIFRQSFAICYLIAKDRGNCKSVMMT